MEDDLKHENAYGLHQIEFFKEAGAKLKAAQASYKASQLGLVKEPSTNAEIEIYKYIHDTVCEDITPIERKNEYAGEIYFRMLLEELCQSPYYKGEYDERWPVKSTDQGLDHIPASLHLPSSFSKYLKMIPRVPLDQKELMSDEKIPPKKEPSLRTSLASHSNQTGADSINQGNTSLKGKNPHHPGR